MDDKLSDKPLSAPDSYRAGHPAERYDELRAICPISWQPDAGGYWAVTGHSEIVDISSDPSRFVSAAGFKLKDDTYARLGADIDAAMGGTILKLDPPMHGLIRSIAAPFFSPASIRLWEPTVRAFTVELLDTLTPNATIDIVRTITAPLPIRVLCELLDVPLSDRARVLDWTNRLTGADDPQYNVDLAAAARAFREVFDYGRLLLQERRVRPGHDILSAFATARVDGEWLEDRYTDAFFVLMVAAGNETTRNALTGAIHLLGRNPTERQRLVRDPGLIRNAAEEILRLVSPVIHMRRTASISTSVSGVPIQNDQRLGLFYGAANRDPRRFPSPCSFDVGRANARSHLAFGFGPHACLGAPLARLEVRVFLEEFLRRFPEYEVVGEPTYLRSDFVCSIKQLMVWLG